MLQAPKPADPTRPHHQTPEDEAPMPLMTQEEYGVAYNRGYVKTVRFMLSRGISRDMSQELAQAAWAKGWEYRRQVRDTHKVDAWVNTIALNLLRSSFRRPETRELKKDTPTSPLTSPETVDGQRLLAQCSIAERELIEGHYIDGYTSAELGSKLNCTAVAVRVRLLRLRRRIQLRLQTTWPPNGLADRSVHAL